MLTKNLIETVFNAANMQRWNDHIRPVNFTELDKQAHKMIAAWMLGKYEEDAGASVDWDIIIKGGIFEFLRRIRLTDIKPSVFRDIVRSRGPQLDEWVINQYRDDLEKICGGSFYEEFTRYLLDAADSLERRILSAAHFMSTCWEFDIIRNSYGFMSGIEETGEQFDAEWKEHLRLESVQMTGRRNRFLDMCGQLRFQKRWSQSPRVPETSVLGHMLVVGLFSYIATLEMGGSGKRRYNNFFGGLFHDLPEVLTRDIISPVKDAVEGLADIIKDYEEEHMKLRLLPALPQSRHEEIVYFTKDEFRDRIIDGKRTVFVEAGAINDRYNCDVYSPVDGSLIRLMDHFAAYVEACISISHGITSGPLEDAKRSLYEKYRDYSVHGISFGKYFEYFH